MERLTFKMREAFSPDDPIAVWVMNLSIALNDLRVVAKYVARAEQPDHERTYFVRIFSSHLREIGKLLVSDYDGRQDVRDFVAGMSKEAQEARDDADALLHGTFPSRPDVVVWRDLKRLRDETFHYANDPRSRERLVEAMRTVAGMFDGEMESAYTRDDRGWTRADYADEVLVNRMHPFPQEHEDGPGFPISHELNETIVKLSRSVTTFIHAAEVHYLIEVLPAGVVRHFRQ